jgi:hypothetical protein
LGGVTGPAGSQRYQEVLSVRLVPGQARKTDRQLIAGEADAAVFDRFGEAAADRAKDEGRDVAFGFERETRGFAWKLEAAVEEQTDFFKEFRRERQVGSAVDTPEPKLFFIALEEAETFFELLHGAIKGRGQEENADIPGMARILSANADAVLAGLIHFDTAAVVIADLRSASGCGFSHNVSLIVKEWTGRSGRLERTPCKEPETFCRISFEEDQPDTIRLAARDAKSKEFARLMLHSLFSMS